MGFIRSCASKLEGSAGRSLVLSLLRLYRSSHATAVVMPAVLQCTVAAAQAMALQVFEDAPGQWHEAVLAELQQHLRSAATECGSLVLGVQTGELSIPCCPFSPDISKNVFLHIHEYICMCVYKAIRIYT